MRICSRYLCLGLVLTCFAFPQQPGSKDKPTSSRQRDATSSKLSNLLESKIKAEWEAFKNKDKKAYSDLLADDFAAVEDDGQGMRTKSAAAAEVERALVNKYDLFALKVTPLDSGAALVTYEVTLQFPPKAQFRFKRVLVSEIWLKQNGQWKARYYQETNVR